MVVLHCYYYNKYLKKGELIKKRGLFRSYSWKSKGMMLQHKLDLVNTFLGLASHSRGKCEWQSSHAENKKSEREWVPQKLSEALPRGRQPRN